MTIRFLGMMAGVAIAGMVSGCAKEVPIATVFTPREVPASLMVLKPVPQCDRVKDPVAGASVPELER